MTDKNEKPSFLSRRVVKTQLRNEWENVKLDEKLRQLTKDRFNKNYAFIKRTQELNQILIQTKKVKTRIPVSPERRLFIKKHGFSINVRDFEMTHFMDQIFNTNTEENTFQQLRHPLIRLTDIVKENEIKKQAEIMENDLKVENIDEAPPPPTMAVLKPMDREKKIMKLRIIEPPKKGRKLSKVRLDKENEVKEGLLSKSQEKELLQQVEIYRRRIISNLEQNSRRPATARTISLLSKRKEKNEGITDNTSNIKSVPNLKGLEKQLPILTVSKTKSQRPHSVLGSERSKGTFRREIKSAKTHKRHNFDYSEMRLHFQGKTASLFVSKF